MFCFKSPSRIASFSSILIASVPFCRIQRNRERLLALGLPGLVEKLQKEVGPLPSGAIAKPKKPRKKVKQESVLRRGGRVGAEDGDGKAPGVRRSSRLAEAADRPKPEPAEARFERQLGEFIVDGTCPKCGRVFEKGHRTHLMSCGGPRAPPSQTRGYTALDRELLSQLTEEDRKDAKKRTLARMKALELSGLVDLTPEAAKFIVIGSKGDPYTVTLADEKHKCTCLDHRFRRHNCKHICLVLSQVGALDDPSNWREAVEGKLDELIKNGQHSDGGPAVVAPPRDREAEMALKFL